MEHAGRAIEDEALREQMKSCSLGTPATRAAIIERLLHVGYAVRKGRQLMATEKGVRLIEVVPPEIASPETTGRWEAALEKIARGQGDSTRFLEGIRRLAAFLTDYAQNSAPACTFEAEARRGKGRGKAKSSSVQSLHIPCPLCKTGQVTENEKAFGCSRWREGCSFTLWKNGVEREGGPLLTEKLVRALLAREDGRLRGSTGTLIYRDGKLFFERKPNS